MDSNIFRQGWFKRGVLRMRANIAELPDGRYSYTDYPDNDGTRDEPLAIGLDILKRGGRMTLDFSRSAAACAGPDWPATF